MFCFWAARLKFWFKTDLGPESSASYYRQGRQLFLTLLAMITRWSRSSAPQGNQCSISHFLANLGEQEDWYCTHIAHQWIDRCQNRVSADQYHLTVSRAQSWTIWLHILIYCDQEPLKVKWTKKMTYFLLSPYLHQTLKRTVLSEIWVKIFLPKPL